VGQRRPQGGSARGTRGRPALRALLRGGRWQWLADRRAPGGASCRIRLVAGGSRRAGTGPSALPVPARFGLSALACCRGLLAAGEALDGGGGVARSGKELQVAGGGGVDVTPEVLAGGVFVGG